MHAPRGPRDRSLTFGQMLAVVTTTGLFLYFAAYLAMSWIWG